MSPTDHTHQLIIRDRNWLDGSNSELDIGGDTESDSEDEAEEPLPINEVTVTDETPRSRWSVDDIEMERSSVCRRLNFKSSVCRRLIFDFNEDNEGEDESSDENDGE